MDFPLIDYLDPAACYAELVHLLHPAGLACPRSPQAIRSPAAYGEAAYVVVS